MTPAIRNVCICLERSGHDRPLRIEAVRAATECMRAALFLSRSVFYTPALAPIAATLARATALPRPSAETERELGNPGPGAMIPMSSDPSGAESGGTPGMAKDPFLASIVRHWTPEAYDADARYRAQEHPFDLCVALAIPGESDQLLKQIQHSERVVGFRRLLDPDVAAPLNMVFLDTDWHPFVRVDSETGKSAEPSEIQPPFGVLLQAYAQSLPQSDGTPA